MSSYSLDRSKIQAEHISRAALVYIRQSSYKQVRENLESGIWQYAFAEQANALGWTELRILILDEDQGDPLTSRDQGVYSSSQLNTI